MIQTDKQISANQIDIMVISYQKIATMIGLTVQNGGNIMKEQYEKLEKYQGLKEGTEKMSLSPLHKTISLQ